MEKGTETMPFVCRQCGKRFFELKILNFHIKEIHRPQRLKRMHYDFYGGNKNHEERVFNNFGNHQNILARNFHDRRDNHVHFHFHMMNKMKKTTRYQQQIKLQQNNNKLNFNDGYESYYDEQVDSDSDDHDHGPSFCELNFNPIDIPNNKFKSESNYSLTHREKIKWNQQLEREIHAIQRLRQKDAKLKGICQQTIIDIFQARIPLKVINLYCSSTPLEVIPEIFIGISSIEELNELKKSFNDASIGLTNKKNDKKVENNPFFRLDKFRKNVDNFYENLMCPISQDFMEVPVVLLESLQCYEKEYIIKWMEGGRSDSECNGKHDSDPTTRVKLQTKEYMINKSLKVVSDAWVKLDIKKKLEKETNILKTKYKNLNTKNEIIKEDLEVDVDVLLRKYWKELRKLKGVLTCRTYGMIFKDPVIMVSNGFSYCKEITRHPNAQNEKFINNLKLRQLVVDWGKMLEDSKEEGLKLISLRSNALNSIKAFYMKKKKEMRVENERLKKKLFQLQREEEKKRKLNELI